MKETIIIAAVAKNNVIGKNNKLPWHITEDLKRFKKLTMNHPVIMGKNTYFSLPIKPLPNRTNIVVSKNKNFKEKNIIVKNTLEDAIAYAHTLDDTVYFIGGASVYKQVIEKDLINKLEITLLEKEYDGDTFFPKINENIWKIVKEKKREGYSFLTYIKK